MVLDFQNIDDAIADAKNKSGDISLILGNGFSSAYGECFRYPTLKSRAEIPNLSRPKDRIFEESGSDDFETTMRRMSYTTSMLRLYSQGSSSDICCQIENDRLLIKNALVETLADIHPPSSRSIDSIKYRRTRSLIRKFSRIYSLNYDLLLYWATLNSDSDGEGIIGTDGFYKDGDSLVWRGHPSTATTKIYYLHGGMHLYYDEEDKKIHKLSNQKGKTIISQVRENLNNGHYPCVVTEGSSKDKIKRILESNYLNTSYESLDTLSGSLFTFGASLDKNDNHIFDKASGAPNLHSLYIGVRNPHSASAININARAQEIKKHHDDKNGKQLTLKFYNSSVPGVW
ncbi:DUF4917 family protein [Corynebacterium variabile]|uniref:DUF4917 family protein n=1 Tax=Corynebacterium variabile TaxID=1727 RepID=UPI0009DB581A|nr:DUF4917 family protein [Corynebacterium variabile]